MYLPEPGADFENAPAGTHLAICTRIIDLGTQLSTFGGKEMLKHKIMLTWELPDEKMKDGRPFTINQRYTWSMDKKANLRKHLEAWRGKAFEEKDFGPNGFNIQKILGLGCILTISHSENGDKTYANVTAVSKLMKGMQNPVRPVSELVYLWLAPDLWEPTTFHKLGQGLQATIMKAPEYVKLTGVENGELPPYDMPPPDFIPDDIDIPF
jgi:hypothetical protein